MNLPLRPEAEAAFSAALELPVSEQNSFLTREYAHDPNLRHEVEALLRAFRDAGSFLDPVGKSPSLSVGASPLPAAVGPLYLIDPNAGTATPVFDFTSIAKGGWPQLMCMTNDGPRLFITMNQAGKVVMFDTSEPAEPTVLDVLDFGPGSGPHYLRLDRDEERLVVSAYFLNEDTFGKVHLEGDHKVHVVRVNRHHMELDPRFQLDFNRAFGTGPARPHGLAFK